MILKLDKNNYQSKNNRYKNNNKNNHKKNNNRNKQKYKYLTVYSEKDYQKDEYDFNKSLAENNINIKSFQRLVQADLLNNTKIIQTDRIGNYTLS